MAWPYPRIVAHRGGGTLAPENTLAAMAAGYARGFRAVEFDVMLSSDEVPVLMHDPEFGRTVAGRGSVASTPAAQLLSMDAGAWFDARFAGEKIPSYRAVLDYCAARAIFMNVEIKPAPGTESATGRVVGLLTAEWLAAHAGASLLFSSFSTDALVAAQAAAPAIARAHLFDRVPDDWRARLAVLGCVALHCNQRWLERSVADAVRAAGYGLFCYTVNDTGRASELLAMGVDAFCTDRIDLFDPDFATREAAGGHERES